MRVGVLVALVAAVAACVAAPLTPAAGDAQSAQERRAASAEVFGGLGTWVDIYDTALYRAPDATAARLAARGVETVWIETANDRSTVDVVEPSGLGRLVDALHTQGLRVVGWYLPGHDQQARDLRRARAMLRFVTQTGGRFDGVALDIESLREKNVTPPHGADARPPDPAARRGRRDAGRRDHVPAAGLRASPELVARLPVGADRRAGGRVRPDALHRRRLQGLRRDLRVRRALAEAAPRRRRAPDRRCTRRAGSPTG